MTKNVIYLGRSSCLESAAYDLNSRELDLVFKSNREKHYVYDGVEPSTVGRLVGADSAGQVYHEEIAGTVEPRTYFRAVS